MPLGRCQLQVIPTPSHFFRPSRPSPRSFSFFARFHRLDEAVPTSPEPERRAKKQPARGPRGENSLLRSTPQTLTKGSTRVQRAHRSFVARENRRAGRRGRYRRTRARWAISPCRSTAETNLRRKFRSCKNRFCKRPAPAPPSRHALPPRSHRTYPPPTGRGPHSFETAVSRAPFSLCSPSLAPGVQHRETVMRRPKKRRRTERSRRSLVRMSAHGSCSLAQYRSTRSAGCPPPPVRSAWPAHSCTNASMIDASRFKLKLKQN